MSRRSFSPHQDPYNVDDEYRQQQQPQQTQTQHHYLDDVDQLAYDSMSTILEVDSEGTNSETSDRLRQFDSPLHIDTIRTPEPRTATLESSSTTTNDRLSPVSDLSPKDKFSGIISALAEQMERLQPSKSTTQQQATKFTSGRQSLVPKYDGVLEDDDDDDATRPPSGVSSSNSSSRRSKSLKEGQHDASTSPISSENNSQSNSPSPPESPRPGSSLGLFGGQKVSSSDPQRAGSSSNLVPKSRATSAESLMMITVSPMVSPKVRFPISKHAKQTSGQIYNDETDSRRIVEVSNKSTITAIDLTLMDKMVQKYFAETKDKATQSIKFDCDDEFDTLEFNNKDGSLRRRTGAGNGSRLVPVKSVAVGTEKFSRERFSLLPPTKTRSTQTKSNMDNDIGASETRRFKLAHLDLGTLRQRSQTKDSSTEVEPNIEGEQQNDEQVAEKSLEEEAESQTMNSKSTTRESLSLAARRSKTPTEERPAVNGKTTPSKTPDLINRNDPKTVESSKKREQSRDSLSPITNLNVVNTSTSNQDKSDNSNQRTTANDSSGSSDSLQQVSLKDDGENRQIQRHIEPVPTKKKLEKVKKVDKAEISEGETKHEQVHQSRALIPSVKTELRVIIEIQDSKQKQVSEIMSNSQLVDGKLSKKTQVNTSKHVAATPREVLNRLQTVGRESSLLYQAPSQQLSEATPGQVARSTNQSALRWSSSPINLQNSSNDFRSTRREEPDDLRNERGNWREVSKSSVVNEIETKTRQKSGKKLNGIPDGQQESDIIMTSDALINHMSNDKSAIELRSRAAQRYENYERDPHTGEMVKTGKISERTLIESEAGFNDEHPNGKSGEKTSNNHAASEVQSLKQHAAIRITPNGRRTPVAVGSNLIDNVEEQQRRLNSRGDFTSPSSHQENATLSPRRQHQVINEPEHRQKPERWTSQSTPNIKSLPQLDRQDPVKPATPIKRHASIEIEEESEDRQQLMENGRLIYDDRLRERKYETQRTSSPSLNVSSQDVNVPKSPLNSRTQRESQKYARSSSMSPRSPILSPITGGILRNREDRGGYSYQQQPASQLAQTQRSQLLKPLSLRPNGRNAVDSPQAPILFADQTSNLSASSDPETMDSGFAQSGAGSSSVLNQRQAAPPPAAISPQYHPITSSRQPGMPITNFNSPEINSRQQRVARDQVRSSNDFEPHQDQLEEPISLNFVDDDVDDLIDQLGNSRTNRSHVVSSPGRTQVESDSYRQSQVRQKGSQMQQKPQIEGKGKFNNSDSCGSKFRER